MNTQTPRRAVYELHSLLGAALGALLFVVCLSGSISVYRDEIRSWATPALRALEHHPERVVPVRVALDTFAQHYDLSQPAVLALRLPSPQHPAYGLLLPGPADAGLERAYVHPESGAFLGEPRSDLADFLFQLHANFTFRSKLGRYVVGLFGVALAILVVTGVVIHRRLLANLFTMRWLHGLRLTFADGHRAIGTWLLPFHLLIALTGAFLGLKDLLIVVPSYAAYGGDRKAAAAESRTKRVSRSGTPRVMPDLDALIQRARAGVAGFSPTLLVLSAFGDENAEIEVAGSLDGHLLPRNEAVRYRFGSDGALLELESARDHSSVRRAYDALLPLHYGDFGGARLQLFYFLFGSMATSLAWTGTFMWLERARRRSTRA